MSNFKGRGKRWSLKRRKSLRLQIKKYFLSKGYIEISENVLVHPFVGSNYPPYRGTHLGRKEIYYGKEFKKSTRARRKRRKIVDRLRDLANALGYA